MEQKVLILDTVHEVLSEMLLSAGFEIVENTSLTRNELLQEIKKFSGIVLRSRINIDQEIIDKAENLKFIARLGSGMESIDVEYAETKGISCINSPEGNSDAVAEHAMGMLLALSNNLMRANFELRQGKWIREPNRGIEIKNKTVGIIGYGNMGSAFAKRLKGFGCKILVYDKYKTGFSNEYVTECNMESIYAETDILSLHIPLSSETQSLVNQDYINRFAKNIILINTARGPIVNTEDLANALKNEKIRGAALDVIEYEETSFEKTSDLMQHEAFKYLAQSDKVILSPHIAGWSFESKYKLAEILASKIIAQFAQ